MKIDILNTSRIEVLTISDAEIIIENKVAELLEKFQKEFKIEILNILKELRK